MNIDRTIIGIAGPTASGKTTVADYLTKHFHAEVFATRDVLQAEAEVRRLPTDKATLQELFATLTRETGNEAVLMDRLTPVVLASWAKTVVIEGCRRLTDLGGLRRLARGTDRRLILIYLDAPSHTRFHRMNERSRSQHKPGMEWSDFKFGESSKSEAELEALRTQFAVSGCCIQNSGITVRELFEAVEDHIGAHAY